MSRLAPVLAAASLAAVWIPSTAAAHAVLEGSAPRAGEVLRAAPSSLVLRFSEPVEGNFGAIRVYDANGKRIDQGGAYHPGGKGSELAVNVRRDAPDGSATAVWRVVSADSHVVSGGLVFAIGRTTVPNRSVSDLAAEGEPSVAVDAAIGIARGLQFLAIGVGLGVVLFLLLTWVPTLSRGPAGGAEADRQLRRRAVIVLRAAGLVGLIASASGIVAQGALAAGVGLFGGGRPDVVMDTLGTRFGAVWAGALIAWGFVVALAGVLRSSGRRSAWVAPPLAFLAAVPALSGHATTHSPTGVLAAANIVHVVAVSAWTGGVVAMLVCALPASRAVGRSGGRLALSSLERFSSVALGAVAVVVLTGILQSLLVLDSVSMLVDSAYGRALLAKIALLAGLLVLGAVHRLVVLPRMRLSDGARGERGIGLATRLLAAETAVFVAVFAATAALASYPPVAPDSQGPVSRTIQSGPVEVQMSVDPARVGVNVIHLYIADTRTGALDSSAREVTVTEVSSADPEGKISQTARRAGPGHWIAGQVPLTSRGDWKVSVAIRVSEFEQYTAEATVPVR
ncbi:MAG: CopD family protein [Actinomycetes bacterium]